MNTLTQTIHHSRYRIAVMLLAWVILLGISGCYSGSRHYVRHQPEVEYEFYYYPSHRRPAAGRCLAGCRWLGGSTQATLAYPAESAGQQETQG